VAGGSAGATFGSVVDDNILNNHECLECGHCFSSASA
jgi:hypothetical protein